MAMTDYGTVAPPYGTKPDGDESIYSDVNEYWSLGRVKRAYLDYLGNKREEIEEQQQARCYRHGAQWTTQQVEIFNKRKQPVVTYNRIGRKVDAIVGLMERLKQDPKAYPRNPKQTDEMGAELATAAVRYVVETELKEFNFPFAVENGAVDGVGGVELMLVEGDKGDTDIGFARVEPDSFFYDPRSYEHDFGDARFMGRGKWLDVEDAKALAPDKADEIEGHLQGGWDLTSNPDRERHWRYMDSENRRVRVVEIWYRHKGGWCWCLFTGFMKLREGQGYFYNEKGEQICKFIMFSSFVDQDGDRYGFIRNLRSSQDEINQRRSKGLHELNSRRIKAEDGAFADIEVTRREAVRPDGVVIYNKGFEMEFDDQARIANVEGQLKFLEDAKAEVENFGPNPALIGQGLEYKSGRAINYLQQAGIAELGPFVIGIRHWKLRIYRAIWNAVQRYWQSERWIRVTDDLGVAQLVQVNGIGIDPATGLPRMINAIGQLDVNFVLDEGPDEVNMMADMYDTLVALSSQGAKVPPAVLLELAPLHASKKRQLLAMLQQPDPVQQAAVTSDIEETKSRTALNLAKAQEAAQGGARGVQEMVLDAGIKREAHQMKMVEGAQKVAVQREVGQMKVAGEFAKLRSKEMQANQDVSINAVKGAQQLRQGEEKHQQAMTQAREKAKAKPKPNGKGLPGYQFGGRPQVGFPSIVGEAGPEVFVPDQAGTIVPKTGLGRGRFLNELQDPAIRNRLIAYTRAEVGGQGPEAQQAFMETIFNRATSRRQSLRDTLAGSYFPAITHSRARQPVGAAAQSSYGDIISRVLAGSNITNYATGNASGNVGFAGGPQTFASGGERFGIEGPDKGWWTRIGAEGPTGPLGVGYTGSGVGIGTSGTVAPGLSLAKLQPKSRIELSPLMDYAAGGAFPKVGG